MNPFFNASLNLTDALVSEDFKGTETLLGTVSISENIIEYFVF